MQFSRTRANDSVRHADTKTIDALEKKYGVAASASIKTLFVEGEDGELVALVCVAIISSIKSKPRNSLA